MTQQEWTTLTHMPIGQSRKNQEKGKERKAERMFWNDLLLTVAEEYNDKIILSSPNIPSTEIFHAEQNLPGQWMMTRTRLDLDSYVIPYYAHGFLHLF